VRITRIEDKKIYLMEKMMIGSDNLAASVEMQHLSYYYLSIHRNMHSHR